MVVTARNHYRPRGETLIMEPAEPTRRDVCSFICKGGMAPSARNILWNWKLSRRGRSASRIVGLTNGQRSRLMKYPSSDTKRRQRNDAYHRRLTGIQGPDADGFEARARPPGIGEGTTGWQNEHTQSFYPRHNHRSGNR
jgi:hypothetical protein